ncbi:MAG: ADP-ribosylglycohydrolase family protein [Methanolinea sp.]|nr:ADP-ribosylglycohydrolase family protein [Methanolinea sp.]
MTFISDIRHATGVLVGLAIGDAMGAPLEGAPSSPGFAGDLLPGGRMARKAGSYTDDTCQALALAESLAACRAFCPEDFMTRLLRDYTLSPEWYGPTSGAVFERVRGGAPLFAAARMVHAERGQSRSNGSVMRGAPIGVFYSGPEVEACSLACSALTHKDPVAGACSSFVNRMVSDMCRGIPKRRAWSRALQRCRIGEVAEVLGKYWSYPRVPGLDALLATLAAVSVFMETESFKETVPAAVSMGGDSDTVGAIAGALAGAAYGVHTIPDSWLLGLSGSERVWRAAYGLWRTAQG